ncbi:MAG: Ig-like domain-containing protein, partial [Gemmatimonadales bacterium]
VTFFATDAHGASDSEEITITVGAVNRPPMLDAIGSRTVKQGETLVISISASDPDGDALSFAVDPLPSGASFVENGATAQFTWTPMATGNYAITFFVTDPFGAGDSEQITITVGAVNRPPVLNPVGNHSATQGEMLTVGISATDPDGDSLTFDVMGAPEGATLMDHGDGTAEMHWMPGPDQLGSYPMTCVAYDEYGASDSEDISITVVKPVVKPEDPPAEPPADYALELRPRWKDGGSKLHVKGKGAEPYAAVELFDADSGALLWEGLADDKGKFNPHLRLLVVPCAVTARAANGAMSEPTAVRDAPSTCGVPALYIRFKDAEWNEDKNRLTVHGDHAPPYATLYVYDATGEYLGKAYADHNGKWRHRASYADPPCSVWVEVEGLHTDPVPVEGAEPYCR